ncbi:sugar transferase [Candidatus Saccharibacteria bacterium]|nr:sugar transferase [Candidatus Saccharibacteria bacterium]
MGKPVKKLEYANAADGATFADVQESIETPVRLTKVSILKHLRTTAYRTIKRLFDIFVGIVGCLLTIPLLGIVKLYNLKHDDHAPLLYAQVRVGKNGKLFKVYKIRSMVHDADAKLAKLLEENAALRAEWEQNHKLKNDPRITRVGRFLRKTSLDEFPQFWNILIGEMSLVGPRPLAVGELDLHGGDHALYESVKPGLTGWWGANGRSDTDYEHRLNLEYFYAKNASLVLDFTCIIKTLLSVFKRKGAV